MFELFLTALLVSFSRPDFLSLFFPSNLAHFGSSCYLTFGYCGSYNGENRVRRQKITFYLGTLM